MSVYAVAITGGSGAPYALRLLQVLLAAGHEVHVCISAAGETVLQVESGVRLGKTLREKAAVLTAAVETEHASKLRLFDPMNLAAPISSGSFPCAGMAIVPCSTGTLGRIANGISSNLIERAADVMLKEKRPLIIVPRETPMSLPQLKNMTLCAEAGAMIMPAMPAFYQMPKTLDDLADFMAGKILSGLGLSHALYPKWEG